MLQIIIKIDQDLNSEGTEIKKFLKHSKSLHWTRNDNQKTFWNSLKFYLPDPPKLPTKEGGAELDVSGAWKFSEIPDQSQGHNLAVALPVKKKCSARSNTSINDSGIYDSHSGQVSVPVMQLGPTRSCGTNAVVHQRSSSALVETIRDANAEGQKRDQRRSKSFYLFQQDEISQPQPQRPKVPSENFTGSKKIVSESTYASPTSILMQLAQVSPDLLSSLNATMTTPLESTPKAASSASKQVKIISPVVARTKRKEQNAYHSRSVSMLDQRNCLGRSVHNKRFMIAQ